VVVRNIQNGLALSQDLCSRENRDVLRICEWPIVAFRFHETLKIRQRTQYRLRGVEHTFDEPIRLGLLTPPNVE
jgi:hypothetical protein